MRWARGFWKDIELQNGVPLTPRVHDVGAVFIRASQNKKAVEETFLSTLGYLNKPSSGLSIFLSSIA